MRSESEEFSEYSAGYSLKSAIKTIFAFAVFAEFADFPTKESFRMKFPNHGSLNQLSTIS